MSNLNKSIPVFFFHMGYQSYLEKIIQQAQLSNERVILLGDNYNQRIEVEHHAVDSYYDKTDAFASRYRHMSTNPPQFEIICFARWFVLRNFMREHNIDICFYADSDIMIHANLTAERAKFEAHDCAFMMPEEQSPYSWSASGHNSYWTLEALEDFCAFINTTYSTPEGIEKLTEKWTFHIENNQPGGICDMTLFWLYYNFKNGNDIHILSNIVENATFDDNIVSSTNRYKDEYRIKDGIKEIEFREDGPYCFNLREEKWVRFNTLHYSGAQTKSLIE